jgi:hypothetical protein
VKMLFLSQFFYSTVRSRSWLTCWKWTAIMTLRFRQQNHVDGDGSWWRFLWPFFVIFFVHSTGILRRIGTKHEISVRKSRENPLEKTLSIVIRFVVSCNFWDSNPWLHNWWSPWPLRRARLHLKHSSFIKVYKHWFWVPFRFSVFVCHKPTGKGNIGVF